MRELSASETLIMKAIWEAGEDIAVPDLTEVLEQKYGKEYKRTTIGTFLLRLSEKRFVTTYRIGRFAYVHAEISEQEYKRELAQRELNFWFKGQASDFIAALCETQEIPKEDADKIRRILDGMDD